MKRKILSMLMVLVLMGVMITGCGKEVATQPEPTNEVTTQSEEPTKEVEPTKEPTEPTEQPTDEVATQPEETPPTEVTSEPTEEVTEPVETAPQFTFTDLSQTMYAANSVNVRDLPSTDGEKLGGLSTNQEVAVTGQCNETSWYRISYNNGEAFVSDKYLVTEKVVTQPVETAQSGGEVAQQPVEETPASNECPVDLYVIHDEGDIVYMWGEFHTRDAYDRYDPKFQELDDYVGSKWPNNHGYLDCDNEVEWNGQYLCRWVFTASE